MTEAIKTRYLRRTEASDYLEREWGIIRTKRTLDTMASTGRGPMVAAYDGRRPLYKEEMLDDYARSQLLIPMPSKNS